MMASEALGFCGEQRVHTVPGQTAIEDTAMPDPLHTDLLLLRQRIESLYDAYPDDEEFQNGLNFAVSGIEQALGAAGGEPDDGLHPGDGIDTLNGIESSLAEMHIRLEARGDEDNDDPAQHARLAMIDHLLQQACALLAD
jgi:hypothetical protein